MSFTTKINKNKNEIIDEKRNECNTIESINDNRLIPITIFRTVAPYQSILKIDNKPKYLASFSDREVTYDEQNNIVSPLYHGQNIQGISIIPEEVAHKEYKVISVDETITWNKTDSRRLECCNFELESFKSNIEDYFEGKQFEVENKNSRKISTYMCYKLPARTLLPYRFKFRQDNDNHCTIFFEEQMNLPPSNTFNIGANQYYYFSELLELPWELHCFKMVTQAESHDFAKFTPNFWTPLLYILIKYIVYFNEQRIHLFSKIFDKLIVEKETYNIKNLLLVSIDDVIDWVDEYELHTLLKYKDEILDQVKAEEVK